MRPARALCALTPGPDMVHAGKALRSLPGGQRANLHNMLMWHYAPSEEKPSGTHLDSGGWLDDGLLKLLLLHLLHALNADDAMQVQLDLDLQ